MEDTREELVCRLIIGERRKGRRKKCRQQIYKIKMKWKQHMIDDLVYRYRRWCSCGHSWLYQEMESEMKVLSLLDFFSSLLMAHHVSIAAERIDFFAGLSCVYFRDPAKRPMWYGIVQWSRVISASLRWNKSSNREIPASFKLFPVSRLRVVLFEFIHRRRVHVVSIE